jgi:hypothetical protein
MKIILLSESVGSYAAGTFQILFAILFWVPDFLALLAVIRLTQFGLQYTMKCRPIPIQ